MLCFLDFLILNTMMSHHSHSSESDGPSIPAVGISARIDIIRKDLGYNFSTGFFEPMVAAATTAAFVDGVTEEKKQEALSKAEKFKSFSQISITRKIINKQPIPFPELKQYLNQVNPHYYDVIDYFIWQTMLGPGDLSDNQKHFIAQWNNYRHYRCHPTENNDSSRQPAQMS